MSITNINGLNGRYDGKINDPSVRYGRNAADNYLQNLEKPLTLDNFAMPPVFEFDFDEEASDRNLGRLEHFVEQNDEYIKSLPPLEYEYRYMPDNGTGKIDKKALLGAAYQEMGALEYPKEVFNKKFLINNNFTSDPIDINKDGKIDVSEYSTNILAADMLSKPEPEVSNIDGTINSKGFNAVLEYSQKSKAAEAAKMYANLYNTYELASEYDSFKADKNNIID